MGHRYQWNALNGGVDFSQSDIERSPKPLLSLAVGAASDRSRYTAFSSSGGGQLDGFSPGEEGRYQVRQRLFEAAFKRQGFSFQHESHWKRISDHANGRITRLREGYLQAGYFFHELWRAVPKQLELAMRGAFVNPDADRPSDIRTQVGFAVNWFFDGHDNKLTLDVFRHRLARPQDDLSDVQVRLQWDLTI